MKKQYLWGTRPIFITSTFRDMHAERDHLRNVVFPELEERLKQRRHHLEPIDLRWGVETGGESEEHAKELLVLKVCLAEVERSRPFLIGLIGDRYGWIPPRERIQAAAHEAGFSGEIKDKSVTDLEIEFGVLSQPEQQRRCFFYLREPLPYDTMSPEKAAEYSDAYKSGTRQGVDKLQALKKRLIERLPNRVRKYQAIWDVELSRITGLEAWGKQVLEDLWQELEQETRAFANLGEPTWQEQERFVLEQFIEDRARGFIGREASLKYAMDIATSSSQDNPIWGLSITGESGSGKSAHFSELHRRLLDHDCLLLAHAAGISPQSNQVDFMLRRWVEELAEENHMNDPMTEDATSEDIERMFGNLLQQTSDHKRVVILIDALNQFEQVPRAQYLTWIPKHWPENARLVTTAIPGKQTEALEKHQMIESHSLPPLDTTESSDIIQQICQRYRRTLNLKAKEVLLQKQTSDQQPAMGNPLWLHLAVEELNLLDADDFNRAEREFSGTPEQQLQLLLISTAEELPPTVSGLYNWLLDRAEQLHGKETTQTFVNLITISRNGWREMDLQNLIPTVAGDSWDPLNFAALRRTLRTHITQKGIESQWDFTHMQMRIAIKQRNLNHPDKVSQLHRQCTDYLLELPKEDTVHETETMYHLMQADDKWRAVHYYAGDLSKSEVQNATQILADAILYGERQEQNDGLQWVLSLIFQDELEDGLKQELSHRLIYNLNEILAINGRLDSRISLLQSAFQLFDRLYKQDPNDTRRQSDLSVCYHKIGDVLRLQGNLEQALYSHQATLTITEQLAKQDQENIKWQQYLSIEHERIGTIHKALGNLKQALSSYQASHTINQQLLSYDPDNTECQFDLVWSQEKIGDIHEAQGNLELALEFHQASLTLRQKLVSHDPDNTQWQRALSVGYNKIGAIYITQGKLEQALEFYKASFSVCEQLLSQDPGNTEWQRSLSISHFKIGDIYKDQGKLEQALESYKVSIKVSEHLILQDPDNTEWQRDLSIKYDRIGIILKAQGNLGQALEYYQASLTICERLGLQNPNNAQWQQDLSTSYAYIGGVQKAQGNLVHAQTSHQKSLSIRERLASQDPDNTQWQLNLSSSYNLIGEIHQFQGNLDHSLISYQASLTICEHLVELDPSNTRWQDILSDCHINIGDIHRFQGDLERALISYQASLKISEQLVKQNSGNTSWQESLAFCHNSIGSIHEAQGNLDQAQDSYQMALAICDRFSSQFPDSTEWLRNTSISRNKIGAIYKAQGKLDQAQASYQASLSISEQLVELDPDNTEWLRDLSINRVRVGDILHVQGNLALALEYYKASLTIGERLVSQDPNNAQWQEDLSSSHVNVGDIQKAQGDHEQAYTSYRASLAIREQLILQDPSNALLEINLSLSHERIGAIKQAQGNLEQAQNSYQDSLKIRERLVAQDPGNAHRQVDLAFNLDSIGSIYQAQSYFQQAQESYQASLTIREQLALQSPNNALYQRNLVLSCYILANYFQESEDIAESNQYWYRCYETMMRMKKAEMYLDPQLARLFEILYENYNKD